MIINSVAIQKVTRPFKFFLKERHTIDSLSEEVINAYRVIVEEHGSVPTIATMQHFLIPLYSAGIIERHILLPRDEEEYDEEEYDEDYFSRDYREHIRDLWDSGDFGNIDDFVYYCVSHFGVSLDPNNTEELFLNDIVYILKINNLYFHNTSPSYEHNLRELKKGRGIYDFHINNPICEVW